jgi:hypothetical protein
MKHRPLSAVMRWSGFRLTRRRQRENRADAWFDATSLISVAEYGRSSARGIA